MSGHSAASAMARDLEASACLTKPIELDDLLETVRRFASVEHDLHPFTAP
jgi:hypothetical protein